MGIWRLSNTGLRNPLRMMEGLRIYSQSNLVGKIHGKSQERALEQLLASHGLLNVTSKSDGTYGRKWRVAWNNYGCVYTKFQKNSGIKQENIGLVDEITPLGWAFIRADTYPAEQECFLRALSVPMEQMDDGRTFSPLRWTLKVLLELEKKTGKAECNFNEFAIYIQTSDPSVDLENLVKHILDLRHRKELSNAKKRFDTKAYQQAKIDQGYKDKAENYKEYGDMNLRNLRAAGIFKRHGRGIAIMKEYHALAEELAENAVSTATAEERYTLLYNIPPLPMDNLDGAKAVLNDLVNTVKQAGIVVDLSGFDLTTTVGVNSARMSLQASLDKTNEEKYAAAQRNEWREIADYMELIQRHGGTKTYDDGSEIVVPKDEAAAYLEWVVWRSFLAIDSLVNAPSEVRSFRIDQDFFPVNTAPGKRPDLIAEFKDCVVVGEVTLSDSSRQEAMEGEPVRRHVADLMQKYDKPVYGLFIANHIDTNTAETFRTGLWYLKDDSEIQLNIVPFTLAQYEQIFVDMFEAKKASPNVLINLIKECGNGKERLKAPVWKTEIGERLQHYEVEIFNILWQEIKCPSCGQYFYLNFDNYLIGKSSQDRPMGKSYLYEFKTDDCKCPYCGKRLRISGYISEYPSESGSVEGIPQIKVKVLN